jgi:hypothetical protein
MMPTKESGIKITQAIATKSRELFNEVETKFIDSYKIQFQSVVAVLVVEKDSVLLDDEEFIKFSEEVAVYHFLSLIFIVI